jgi:pyrroline-5-carboxylate reductase
LVIYEAALRFVEPEPVVGGRMLVIATIGFVATALTAVGPTYVFSIIKAFKDAATQLLRKSEQARRN